MDLMDDFTEMERLDLDASDCFCQNSEGNGIFEHYPLSNIQSALGESEPDISGTRNHTHKSRQLPGRTAPDSYKNIEPISPVHADHSEGHSIVASSSNMEEFPPVEYLVNKYYSSLLSREFCCTGINTL